MLPCCLLASIAETSIGNLEVSHRLPAPLVHLPDIGGFSTFATNTPQPIESTDMNNFAMTNSTAAAAPITMSSRELVDFINDSRNSGEATVEHYDLLKKVPLVLGGGAGKFSGTYMDVQGKARPCYNFPKREACLMAMSYSYDLQAKVFDRMTELEAQVTKPAFQLPQTMGQALALAAQQWEMAEAATAKVVLLTAAHICTATQQHRRAPQWQ